VTFTWIAEHGDHRIEVVIDPEDYIIEPSSGEGERNVIGRTVKIEGSFIMKELIDDNPLVSALLIILLGVIIAVGAVMLMRKREEGRPLLPGGPELTIRKRPAVHRIRYV